ncbi:radical SAM/SPASM domain-containing protein [Bacillus cereus group sp. BfR-BA-01400]|uniref:radical SAM/SPASM domain-containing protein n=1 Tax=unclassified Bacillus cereus group TaxID=2750818 RepID=UPI001F59109A
MMDTDFLKKIDKSKISNMDHLEQFDYLDSIRSRRPFVEQIETTNACDCTCVMCPRGIGLMDRAVSPMSMDLYEKIINEVNEFFPNGYVPEFVEQSQPIEEMVSSNYEITGIRLHHFGEPLLDPKLCERVTYSRENSNVDVHFSVNPTKLKPKISERLIKSGIKRLLIALDGTNDEEYKEIRGKTVNYEKAVSNILAFIKLRDELNPALIIDLQMVSMSRTRESIEEFKDFWESKGVNVYIKHFFPYPDVNHEEFKIENEDVFFKGCTFPFTSMTIMKDGTVVPCCSDYNGEINLGNVNVNSLDEIWNGETYREFRKDFITNNLSEDSVCRRCGFYKFYNVSKEESEQNVR